MLGAGALGICLTTGLKVRIVTEGFVVPLLQVVDILIAFAFRSYPGEALRGTPLKLCLGDFFQGVLSEGDKRDSKDSMPDVVLTTYTRQVNN